MAYYEEVLYTQAAFYHKETGLLYSCHGVAVTGEKILLCPRKKEIIVVPKDSLLYEETDKKLLDCVFTRKQIVKKVNGDIVKTMIVALYNWHYDSCYKDKAGNVYNLVYHKDYMFEEIEA